MTLGELKELIAADEGETVEVKETTGQRRDASETLCAFLNKDGGAVVFGVSRKGKLSGQLIAGTTKRDLFDAFQKFEPAADIEVSYDWTGDNAPDWKTGTDTARTGTTHRLSGTVWAITGTTGAMGVEDILAHLTRLRKAARMNVETVLHELIADRNVTIPQICARTGMALRTINNALATLRGAGILKAKGDEGQGIAGDCD